MLVTKRHKKYDWKSRPFGFDTFGLPSCYLPFGKEAYQGKVATALFILDNKFEFNDIVQAAYQNRRGRLKRAWAVPRGQLWIQDMLYVNLLQYTWKKNTFKLKRLLLIIFVDFSAQISYLDHYACLHPCVLRFANQI